MWAEGTSYSIKDELNVRGYKWNNGKGGRPKSWYIEVDEHAREAEIDFLNKNIYKRNVNIRTQVIDALFRFSDREDEPLH